MEMRPTVGDLHMSLDITGLTSVNRFPCGRDT